AALDEVLRVAQFLAAAEVHVRLERRHAADEPVLLVEGHAPLDGFLDVLVRLEKGGADLLQHRAREIRRLCDVGVYAWVGCHCRFSHWIGFGLAERVEVINHGRSSVAEASKGFRLKSNRRGSPFWIPRSCVAIGGTETKNPPKLPSAGRIRSRSRAYRRGLTNSSSTAFAISSGGRMPWASRKSWNSFWLNLSPSASSVFARSSCSFMWP